MSRPEYGSDLHLWNQPEADPFCRECGSRTCIGRSECAPQAVARSTDPGTSWEAARSITPEKLRESQQRVLYILKEFGPVEGGGMTDEALYDYLASWWPRLFTPSGARTRRSELVAMGLVRDSGRKDTLRSGRRAIVWEAVP